MQVNNMLQVIQLGDFEEKREHKHTQLKATKSESKKPVKHA